MPLRFASGERPAAPRLLRRGPWTRVGSLVAALVLVAMAMQHVQSDRTRRTLETLLEEPPAAPVRDQTIAQTVLGVDPQKLTDVRDNTYFRDEEQTAWFALWEVASVSTAADLQALATPVVYAQLAQQPAVYRGRVVSVRGEVVRIEATKPAKNELGIETLYRVVVRPAGGDLLPILLYVRELPSGFAPESVPPHTATLAGYFFKNVTYANSSGVNISPVLVAPTFTARVEMAETPADEPAWPLWQAVAGAVVVALGAVVWIWLAAREPHRVREQVTIDLPNDEEANHDG